jgi:hypothetical protein
VYDCRTVTQDALDLMSAFGECTFCHEAVPVAVAACHAAHGGAPAPRGDADSPAGAGGARTADSGADIAAQKAREYAQRMVEYDRTASKRTNVIDDQGDFYEIEGNAWLTPDERAEMKQRQVLEERVGEERRGRMVVSVDLIGRTVRTLRIARIFTGP